MPISKHQIHDRLADIARECAEPGWEGDGSLAVEHQTLAFAGQLIESLPPALETPEISAEPDGHVNLEWYVNPRRVLTVSVTPSAILHWAALIDDEDPRGSCPLSDDVPETLLYWIGRVSDG